MVAAATIATGGIAGALLISAIAGVGTAAVINLAVSDYRSGSVSDPLKYIGVGFVSSGIVALAGAACVFAPYAASAFVSAYLPAGAMVGGSYLSASALTVARTYALQAATAVNFIFKFSDAMEYGGGLNFVKQLTGMSDDTYQTIDSILSLVELQTIMMGASNPRYWDDRRQLQNNPLCTTTSMDAELAQGRQDWQTFNQARKYQATMQQAVSEDGSKIISYTDYENICQHSIHNPGKDKVMLGKYDGGGATSYITKAGSDYTYFDLGDEWNSIKEIYGFTDDDMFKLFNESSLEDGINAQVTFYFSHSPINDTGALGMEYQYLLDNGYIWDSTTMTMKPGS